MEVRRQRELGSRSLTERVSGADRGDVVRWEAGEAHETVATSAFAAVVVEASALRLG